MYKQISTDIKVNRIYGDLANVIRQDMRGCPGTGGGSVNYLKDFINAFNRRYDTNYVFIDDRDFSARVLSEESKDMDKVFVKVAKQSIPPGIPIRIYKES